MAQIIDFIIYGRIFFNIRIRGRHVGFRLIIIIITDEIFHRIFRKELFEFCIKLSGQRFIGSHHQGRPLHLLDDFGHGKSFTGTGHSQQGLLLVTFKQSLGQLMDRFRLVPGGFIFRM